jgi:hypothetical protein
LQKVIAFNMNHQMASGNQNIVCKLAQIVPATPSIWNSQFLLSACSDRARRVFPSKNANLHVCICIHAYAQASTLIKLISRCGVSLSHFLCATGSRVCECGSGQK